MTSIDNQLDKNILILLVTKPEDDSEPLEVIKS